MKSTLLIICLNAVFICFGLPIASAKDAPTSAEQLRSEIESALRAKDTNAFKALFNWQEVSESMKADINDANADLFRQDIASVQLTALPANAQLTNELNGILYKPNVTIIGQVDVEYPDKGNSVRMAYGTKGGIFYLSATVEERIATPTEKEKSLNISVMGTATFVSNGDKTTKSQAAFSGSYVYVKGGKEITAIINGKGNKSEAFWGDYIKSCTVRKSADNRDWIKLVISEDGKNVFESEEFTNKEPIVYEKK